MPKDAVFTVKLDAELHDAFMAEASATDRPASQLVRDFMREYVKRRHQEREHDTWFRAEVETALRDAADPTARRISHDEVMRKMRARIEDRIAEATESEG